MKNAKAQTTRHLDEGATGPFAELQITRVIREAHPLSLSPHGYSFGAMIDERIAEAMEGGDEITELTIRFEPNEWTRLVNESVYGEYKPLKRAEDR